jgi:hypothetical protein
MELTCIQNWDVFLEREEHPSVVMAHENWIARLAITSLAVQPGDRAFISDYVCAKCLEGLAKLDSKFAEKVFVV